MTDPSASFALALAPLLYVPGDRPDLAEILGGKRPLGPCALAICLEDAVRPDRRKEAGAAVIQALRQAEGKPSRPVLVRPADDEMLHYLLDQAPLGRIAGFVAPKATAHRIGAWSSAVAGRSVVYPILETREVLDPVGRRELCQACLQHPREIHRVRIGANDLFARLGGLRRPARRTIYETPVGRVIDAVLETFAGQIPLSAAVFDRLDDHTTLRREVEDDVQRGLFCKTALHPAQVQVIWQGYKPHAEEVQEARRILDPSSPAVFGLNGSMLEPACHSEWARRLLDRLRLVEQGESAEYRRSRGGAA